MFLPILQSSYWPNSCKQTTPAAAIAIYRLLTLPVETWIRFIGWMALGVVVYFVYGYRRSRLSGQRNPDPDATASMSST